MWLYQNTASPKRGSVARPPAQLLVSVTLGRRPSVSFGTNGKYLLGASALGEDRRAYVAPPAYPSLR